MIPIEVANIADLLEQYFELEDDNGVDRDYAIFVAYKIYETLKLCKCP